MSQSLGAQPLSFQNNLLWKDTKGLTKAENCVRTINERSPFIIAEDQKGDASAKIEMRLNNSKALKTVPNRSILILKDTREVQHTLSVSIAGLAKNRIYKNPASRSDEGRIFESQLQNIDDYIIHVQNDSENAKVTSPFFKVAGTLWQVAMQDDKYHGLSCFEGTSKKEYSIFNVFTLNSEQEIAQVAVSPENTEIFKSIKVFSADEIESLVAKVEQSADDLGNDQQTDLILKDSFSTITDFESSGYKSTPKTTFAKPPVMIKTKLGKDGKIIAYEVVKTISDAVTHPKTTAKKFVQDIADRITGRKNSTNDNQSTIVDYLVCTHDSGLAIRNEKAELLFTADRFENVQIVQSWQQNTDKTRILVKFPNRKGQTGYAASEFIKLKSACKSYQEEQKQKNDAEENIDISKGGSLKSEDCCVFPTKERPTHSYKEGMRKFKAGRGKGRRLHAACDLYRKKGDPAVAVTTGKVVRNMYFFYQGTFAVEVAHTGGQIARYGELTGKRADNISAGKSVSPGQTLGFIGKVNSGCCKPMLHFELFSGGKKGSLSNFSNRPFQRRSDLMNPTEYLTRWEKKQFGVAY